jgi:glycosyltransferase involved in cell wall biosynthesis
MSDFEPTPKAMRIAYDYQIFNWQKYGGISRYFCELASRLDRMPDTEARILAGCHINGYLDQYDANLTIGCRRPPMRAFNGVSSRLNLCWSNYHLRQHPPDILHQTYYQPGPQARGALRVLTVYDMIHERFRDSLLPRDEKTIPAKAAAVAAADWIICPSENTKRDLQEFCEVDPDKLTVIYHGYGLMTNEVQLPPMEWLDQPYILFVGTRGWYKNFDRLLQAYADRFSNDCRLVCFGSNPFTNAEQQQISKLGLNAQQVRWTSGSDALLRGFYQKAALFAYPTMYEGFGYPPFEAMVNNCPVACSNVSCFPETIANAAEMFDPQDVDSIAGAIERVLSSGERRAELIKLGQQRLQLFSWQACAEDHRQLYQSLLA